MLCSKSSLQIVLGNITVSQHDRAEHLHLGSVLKKVIEFSQDWSLILTNENLNCMFITRSMTKRDLEYNTTGL